MNNHRTTNQVVETRTRDRHFSKGIVVAMSCEILKINDETYRVQSEKAVDRYYVVRFSDGEPNYCTCKNWEIQSQRNTNHVCKHMKAIIYSEIHGLIVFVPAFPKELKHDNTVKLQYEKEEYSY